MKKIYVILLQVLLIFSLSGCNSSSEAEQVITSTTDQELLNEAISEKSLEKCELIEEASLKSDCKQSVEQLLLLSKAIVENNESLCSSIKLKQQKAQCELHFKEQKRKQLSEEKRKQEQEKVEQETQKLVDIGDESKCGDLPVPDRFICFDNIITNRAVAEKNPSLCDELGDQETISICKKSIENASLDENSEEG